MHVRGTSDPSINGKPGNVLSFDASSGCYAVGIINTRRTVSLKPEKVVVPNCTVVNLFSTGRMGPGGEGEALRR